MHTAYEEMKRLYLRGWHTWNVRSVLSHVHMPDGLALNLALKEYASGHYLKETLIGRFPGGNGGAPVEEAFPGPHAYDGSYTEMTVRWCGIEIRVESTLEEGELVLLVTPLAGQVRPALLVIEGGFLWGQPGWLERCEGTLAAHTPTGERLVFTSGTPQEDSNIPVQTAYLSVALDGPVTVSTGSPWAVARATALLQARREAHEKGTARSSELREMYLAMESALAWDTIYDAKHDRVISPVSRLWSIDNGGYVLFCWDTFFAGYMASLGSPELAVSNLCEILNERTADGFVPNFAYATGQVSADRSQPPVGSAMLLETYRVLGEKRIVEEMFDDLLQWNRWFAAHRRNPNGTMSWGSGQIPVLYGNRWEREGVHGRFGAALESGLDNSPMYDDIPFDEATDRMQLEDVGLTGLYILDCRSLLELARLIGREEVMGELTERLRLACAGLETLWDEERGFYYNRRSDTGAFSRRISPTNFYALFAPDLPAERQRRIADEHYYNPDEFYGAWMLPSISRGDPAYPEQDYWRGRVWAPLNFLVYLALKRTGLADVRSDLAQKSAALFLKEWRAHRHIHENYNSITGEGCDVANSDRFYHWGALLCAVALAEAGEPQGFGMPLAQSEA